jgi:2-dehydropantoate 2-reductase
VRYIIYGAGAVGGTLGARLFETGCDVLLVARGDHGRAMAANGLRFGTPADGWRTLRIPVVQSADQISFAAGDVIVLALKSQGTDAALEALAPRTGPDIPILCAQNGVENERRALRRFANVHGVCVMMQASLNEPGVVFVNNTPYHGICDIGRYPSGIDAIDEAFAAATQAASIHSTARAEIMPFKYAKLLSNLVNVLEAASGRAALGSSLAQRARSEAERVYAAAGVTISRAAESRFGSMKIADVAGVSRVGGSTAQSVARGAASLEIDDLNGEIVLLGRLHGVATPVNQLLQQLALRLVTEGAAPGSMSLEQLETMV